MVELVANRYATISGNNASILKQISNLVGGVNVSAGSRDGPVAAVAVAMGAPLGPDDVAAGVDQATMICGLDSNGSVAQPIVFAPGNRAIDDLECQRSCVADRH